MLPSVLLTEWNKNSSTRSGFVRREFFKDLSVDSKDFLSVPESDNDDIISIKVVHRVLPNHVTESYRLFEIFEVSFFYIHFSFVLPQHLHMLPHKDDETVVFTALLRSNVEFYETLMSRCVVCCVVCCVVYSRVCWPSRWLITSLRCIQ